MKINIKTAAVSLIALAAVISGLLAFCSVKGKYYLMSEPELKTAASSLEIKTERGYAPLQLCRESLPTELERAVYDIIYESLTENLYSAQMSFASADKNDFHIAYNAVLSDHPEIFWADTEAGYSYYEYGGSLSAKVSYTNEGDELARMKEELQAAVSEVVETAPKSVDDYDMELFLNDWFTDNVAYDTNAAMKHNAYGALVNGSAVCDGYSHAFQLLCRNLSLDCAVIEGTSELSESADDGHMWNCVKLGDSWYHIDVTWNDSTEAETSAEHYFYLNLTDEQISADHIISGDFEHRMENKGNFFNIFLPECNSAEYNYLKRNFVTINPDNYDQMLAALIQAVRDKSDCCAFYVDESDDFAEAQDKLINNYAADLLNGANHFTDGALKNPSDCKIVTYENKRVAGIQLVY